MFSERVLLRCSAAAAAAAQMHAGTALDAVSAAGAGVGQSAAPALVSASSPAPHAAVTQVRLSVWPVRRSTLHTGGQRDQSGQRSAAAARPRVRRTAQDGEHDSLRLIL